MEVDVETIDLDDWDEEIQELRQSFMKKFMISICIATIRRTPPGMTPKQYAVTLQDQYRSKQPEITARSNAVYAKQKGELFKELSSIPAEFVPDKPAASYVFTQEEEDLLNDEDEDLLNGKDKDLSKGKNVDYLTTEDEDITSLEKSFSLKNQDHLNFINAMIQIHTMTNSKSAIPVQKYRTMLTNITCRGKSTSQERDSGIGESYESQSLSILSGDVASVLRTKKSDTMLVRAIDIVLESLTTFIRVPSSGIAMWRDDSMLNSTLKEMVCLVDSVGHENAINNCRIRCSSFISQVFQSILLERELNTSPLQFLRCKVITELSKSTFLRLDAIGNIIDILQAFSNNLKSQDSPDIEVHPADIENMFYLYHILKELLTRHMSMKVNLVPEKSVAKKQGNVMELWKRDLRKVVVEVDPEERWKEVLEAITSLLMEHQPLLTFVNYECLTLLQPKTTQ